MAQDVHETASPRFVDACVRYDDQRLRRSGSARLALRRCLWANIAGWNPETTHLLAADRETALVAGPRASCDATSIVIAGWKSLSRVQRPQLGLLPQLTERRVWPKRQSGGPVGRDRSSQVQPERSATRKHDA